MNDHRCRRRRRDGDRYLPTGERRARRSARSSFAAKAGGEGPTRGMKMMRMGMMMPTKTKTTPQPTPYHSPKRRRRRRRSRTSQPPQRPRLRLRRKTRRRDGDVVSSSSTRSTTTFRRERARISFPRERGGTDCFRAVNPVRVRIPGFPTAGAGKALSSFPRVLGPPGSTGLSLCSVPFVGVTARDCPRPVRSLDAAR